MTAVAAACDAQRFDMDARAVCADCDVCDNCNPEYAARRSTHISAGCKKGRACGCAATCVCLCEHSFDGRSKEFRRAGKFRAGAGKDGIRRARMALRAARSEDDASESCGQKHGS